MQQYTVRPLEVFCEVCANDLARLLDLQHAGEVVVEPIQTLRDSVRCGKCDKRIARTA